jgi:hypothetical protein
VKYIIPIRWIKFINTAEQFYEVSYQVLLNHIRFSYFQTETQYAFRYY